MNDEKPINDLNSGTIVTPPIVDDSVWKKIVDKILPIATKVFSKLYSNKMIFWSLCIFLSLVLFIIIVGTLFGKKSVNTPNPTPSNIPFVLKKPTTILNNDVLSTSQEKLLLLKSKINELDVKQGRLLPPTLNFSIKF